MAEVAGPLVPVLSLLRRAYPDGLKGEQYQAALVVLSEYLSDRNLGAVISAFTKTHPTIAQNDLAAALSLQRPPTSVITQTEKHLHQQDIDNALNDGE